MVICVFGDSIAWGAHDPAGGWVERLRRHWLSCANHVRVCNLSVSGESSGEVLARVDADAAAHAPTILVYAVGINDAQYLQSLARVRTGTDGFAANVKALHAAAARHAEHVMFVGLTPVDEKRTRPFVLNTDVCFSNADIQPLNRIIADYCQGHRLTFISLDGLLGPDELTDGLHPDGEGHRRIYERIKAALTPLIEA